MTASLFALGEDIQQTPRRRHLLFVCLFFYVTDIKGNPHKKYVSRTERSPLCTRIAAS